MDKITIQRFRSFTEPQTMTVEPDVTCLVGKNESGKTTILEALHRLNPANTATTFDVPVEYPRRRLARDRRKEELEEVEPITGVFSLETPDFAAVERVLGFPPPPRTRVSASRTYSNELLVSIICPIESIVAIAGPRCRGRSRRRDRTAQGGNGRGRAFPSR